VQEPRRHTATTVEVNNLERVALLEQSLCSMSPIAPMRNSKKLGLRAATQGSRGSYAFQKRIRYIGS